MLAVFGLGPNLNGSAFFINKKAMGIECQGKDVFDPFGELLPSVIEKACAQAGLLNWEKVAGAREIITDSLPSRSPVLCPGCPHRSTFYNLAKKKKLGIRRK